MKGIGQVIRKTVDWRQSRADELAAALESLKPLFDGREWTIAEKEIISMAFVRLANYRLGVDKT